MPPSSKPDPKSSRRRRYVAAHRERLWQTFCYAVRDAMLSPEAGLREVGIPLGGAYGMDELRLVSVYGNDVRRFTNSYVRNYHADAEFLHRWHTWVFRAYRCESTAASDVSQRMDKQEYDARTHVPEDGGLQMPLTMHIPCDSHTIVNYGHTLYVDVSGTERRPFSLVLVTAEFDRKNAGSFDRLSVWSACCDMKLAMCSSANNNWADVHWAVVLMQSLFLKRYYDPADALCRRRLRRELEEDLLPSLRQL